MKYLTRHFLWFILLLWHTGTVFAEGEHIEMIQVRGNARVETDAILTILKTRQGDPLEEKVVSEDLSSLYELGYFSDIRFYKKTSASGITLIIEVAEKPAITEIAFEGMGEVKEEDVKEKLETKLYTIVSESKVIGDVRVIEKAYAEKGFYLAKVIYKLEKKGNNEVKLTYQVEEGGVLQIADINIIGNEYFTDIQIIQKLASQPLTRASVYGSSSLYKEEFVRNDLGILAYYYRDQGFAEVQVSKPHQLLDPDRKHVRLTYRVQEGLQYNIGTINVSGDLLFTKEELIEAMKLKPDKLFRQSFFNKDIEMITDKYGDLGYAYADVNPIVNYDREKKLAHINYEITKGEKVYFGNMTILGNTKTRDNVVRREFEVADSELYSGTSLNKTKKNINRLGFFEDLQIIRERDAGDETLLNLKYKVKEKPTGQLQAAIGYTPAQGGSAKSGFFGQGRYDEQNQSGRGWKTGITGKWDGDKTYSLELTFKEPRINDSLWYAGTSLFLMNELEEPIEDVTIEERRVGASVFVGRRLFELVDGQVTYRIAKVSQTFDTYLDPKFYDQGLSSSVIFGINRFDVDNNISPTEGSEIKLKQQVTGGDFLGGDHQYMESAANAAYYYPVDFTESFRTFFRLYGDIAYIYPYGDKPVPYSERYQLGTFNDLRGFSYEKLRIGPRYHILRAPGNPPQEFNNGGDKRLFFQFEYYLPLIPEAGIRFLTFYDTGRVYNEDENITFTDFYKDVGFGIRWLTPIAPFRFEWAYPVMPDGRLGDAKLIFAIGY